MPYFVVAYVYHIAVEAANQEEAVQKAEAVLVKQGLGQDETETEGEFWRCFSHDSGPWQTEYDANRAVERQCDNEEDLHKEDK